ALFVMNDEVVEARSEIALSPAVNRALDEPKLREQIGRLGETPFVLRALDLSGLASGLFLPVSELNRMRQTAVDTLMLRRGWENGATHGERTARIRAELSAISALSAEQLSAPNVRGISSNISNSRSFVLVAEVYDAEDARAAAGNGATEVVLDPFLRHPIPPVSRVRDLGEELAALGVRLRLRTPTIVRPEDRKSMQRWLDLGLPILTGHVGLLADLAASGRDVVGDYAINCFNAHTAAEYFRLGATRLTTSVELTVDEIAALVSPWGGTGFEVVLYGRPEGMTIEHCVLSAAFNRIATTCRDLCVQKHPVVEITDPAGYTFPVATDAHCRNRLLHSRPIEGSEFLPALWAAGIRSYRALFNVPGERVTDVTKSYAEALGAVRDGANVVRTPLRDALDNQFTRGHFSRAV
ncbi:MAG: DUF3656 domain-containing protein, partial [Gemmatimonadaceae bacterium]